MSKSLVATAALVALAATSQLAHADITEPAQEPALAPPSSVAPQPTFATPPVQDDEDETPSLSAGRLGGELLLGGAFAVGGVLGGAVIGAASEDCHDTDEEFCGLGGAIVGGAIGLTVAAPVGVYIVGSSSGQTGSFAATMAGSVLGSVAGIGLAVGADNALSVPLVVLGPVVGSMVGFNFTRKWDESHPHPRHMIVPVASATGERTTFGVAGAF